jgi:hypothetical protein
MAYAAWSVAFGEQPSAAKWNILGTNDAHFNTILATAGDAWASFTPSWSNLSVGTGGSAANVGWYQLVGKTLTGYTRTVLGSSGASVGTGPYFNTPVNQSSNYNTSYNFGIGDCWVTDAGTQQYTGVAGLNGTGSANRIQPLVTVVNTGAYAVPSGLTATLPMTWAAGDSITTTFIYETA